MCADGLGQCVARTKEVDGPSPTIIARQDQKTGFRIQDTRQRRARARGWGPRTGGLKGTDPPRRDDRESGVRMKSICQGRRIWCRRRRFLRTSDFVVGGASAATLPRRGTEAGGVAHPRRPCRVAAPRQAPLMRDPATNSSLIRFQESQGRRISKAVKSISSSPL